MKILLIGGHLSPLLATIESLTQEATTEIVVVSRRTSMEGRSQQAVESQILEAKGLTVFYITTGRLQRHFSVHSISSLVKVPLGLYQSFVILRRCRPNVIIGFGGYLSLPVILSGWLLGIPTIIHEQSVHAGLANRIAGIFAKKVCLAWSSSRRYFPKDKTIIIGNPIRQAFIDKNLQASAPLQNFFAQEPALPLLYITGGNQGSHVINQAIMKVLPDLLKNCRIIHQVGGVAPADYQQAVTILDSLAPDQKDRYYVATFMQDPDASIAMREATLVIGRAGANTVTEVAYLGKPTIFIPLPYAQKNEQYENASMLARCGLAKILEQKDVTPDRLQNLIDEMVRNSTTYQAHAEDARALIKTDAGQTLKTLALEIASK